MHRMRMPFDRQMRTCEPSRPSRTQGARAALLDFVSRSSDQGRSSQATQEHFDSFTGHRGAYKEPSMSPLALFGTSIALSFLAWGIVVARYLWPELRRQPRVDAMQPLILLHCFRFVGLSFLVPGVVSPELPTAWALPAAYGDLIAAVLALLALPVLRSSLGIALVWVFNLWGSADLVYAFYQGNQIGLEPGQLGAAYFIVTVLVPLLLITHGLVFRLLLQPGNSEDSRSNSQTSTSG